MYRITAICLLLCLCSNSSSVYCSTYNYVPYLAQNGQVYVGPSSGEAASAAYTNAAASAAVATHLTAADYELLEKLARERREPFLTGPNLEFSPFASAILPARAQVIQTPAGFYKTYDGKVEFVSGSSLAFVAV